MDKTKKRARDNVESNVSVQGQSKYLKEQPSVLPVTSRSSLAQLVNLSLHPVIYFSVCIVSIKHPNFFLDMH